MTSNTPPRVRPTAREAGIAIGRLPTGPSNAITDVAGVSVGHTTLFSDSGRKAVRTGVTVVLPHSGNLFDQKVVAAAHVINGFGKAAGTTQVIELGALETPIALTNTLSVGAAFDGLVDHALSLNPDLTSVNPVVGECNDSYLNDIRGRHVRPQHILDAIANAASGPVAQGVVGAGTGMSCYEWKGGIGTSSRRIDPDLGGYSLGVLVLANFGHAEDLIVAGIPVGLHLVPPTSDQPKMPPQPGSIIVVIATDAPTTSRQLERIAHRVQTGLARTGTFGSHGSGEYVLAFSTARTIPHHPSGPTLTTEELAENGPVIDSLFQATVEATEEAVINALFTADTVEGIDGHIRYGVSIDGVVELYRKSQASAVTGRASIRLPWHSPSADTQTR